MKLWKDISFSFCVSSSEAREFTILYRRQCPRAICCDNKIGVSYADGLATTSRVLLVLLSGKSDLLDDCCIVAADMSQQVQAAMENMLKVIK